MKESNKPFITFLRRNAVYLVLALCIIAVGIATTFMLVERVRDNNSELNNELPDQPDLPTDNPSDNIPDEPVDNPDQPAQPDVPVIETIIFEMPIQNATSILEYSDTMVFNSTLGRYSAHKAVDFFAPEGTEVLAVYKGTVKNIENSIIHGVTITIEHGNGLLTVYNSLLDADMVSVGMSVDKGQVIGQVSTSNRQEYKEGAHLHFQVIEDGNVIDPAKYLAFEEK